MTLVTSIVQQTFAVCGAAKTLRLVYLGKRWLDESRSLLLVYWSETDYVVSSFIKQKLFGQITDVKRV